MPRRKATREQLEQDIAKGLTLDAIRLKYGYKNTNSVSTVLSRLDLRTRARENEQKMLQKYAVTPKVQQTPIRTLVYQYWGNGKLESYNRLEEFWAHESYTEIREQEVSDDAA